MPRVICSLLYMNQQFLLALLLTCFLPGALLQAQDQGQAETRQQIERVLADQTAAWNKGDIDAFMDGYLKTAALRFASGDTVTYGWQNTLDRYKQRYPNRAAMGNLSFTDLDTTILAPDAAIVFGRWHLKTDHGEPHGLFTLLFHKSGQDWRIMADHTSAAPER